MRFSLKLAAFALFFTPVLSRAQTDSSTRNVIQKSAVEFNRFELDDNAKVEAVRRSGNLAGIIPESPANPYVTGWFEYDFSVSQAGWYSLDVQPSGGGHEFLIDGKDLYYGSAQKVTNLWLEAGAHTLRIQRTFWTGFGKITGWQLVSAGQDPADHIAIRAANPWKVIRKGESLPVTVSFGELAAPMKLSLLVRERGKQDVLQTIPVNLPAGGGFQQTTVGIPGSRQGVYEVGYQVDELAPQPAVLPPLQFAVVDTTPVAPKDGEVEKTLVAEIDVAKQVPDFFKGGETRVVNKPWGSYRESGDVGYLQRMNSTDPSWFAYKYQVGDPKALYWMEFDFPDDARRSFLVVPRSGNALIPGQHSYAGPGTGPDTGREFSLTNRMQTMGIYFWPHSTDLRAAILQPQSGLRAAVSKIRIYKVESPLAPLPDAKHGRDFIHWYEEGSSFMGYFGAPNKDPESVIVAADNWARIMAHQGASLLMPTLSIYQMAMYPSALNPNFADSNTFDAARVIELACEKYGLKFATEFHPEGRQLKWPSALAKSPDSIYQFNRFGKVWEGGAGPRFNFLHPLVEKFAVDLVGEFADRYGDSPAFEGVSIRLMGWQNTGFGNFDNLSWGYGDFTIRLFEQETGIRIPVAQEDPERFEKRYQWLQANAGQQWSGWRCQKATEFFAKVSVRLREKHPEAKLFLTDFLAPNPSDPQNWHKNFRKIPRDAGIDPARLAAVKGVELIAAAIFYGRRSTEESDQRGRDAVLTPALLGRLKHEDKALGFLTSQAYFEATEAVAPPKDLGYPQNTAHGWMSGAVNPAGRHYLERFALPLAEFDAASLGDGGNGYTVGQPLLREFLREYRALPQENFQARQDARDPVAVWERQVTGDFLFYAVNRERYPVKVDVEFAESPVITRLSTREGLKTDGKTLRMELKPYELRAFSAGLGAKIQKVVETIPDADLSHVRNLTAWLRRLADDVAAGTAGTELTSEQKTLLGNAASEAETCLKQGRFWRARTLQEDQQLRDIYDRCGRIPPLLDQNGPLRLPEGSTSSHALLSKVTSKNTALLASETVTPDWNGQELVVSTSGELTLSIEVPVDGKYLFRFGQVVGEGFSDSAVKVDGKDVGVLKSRAEPIHGVPAMLPTPVTLSKGTHEVSLLPADGKRQGLLFLEMVPVYQDIVANRWMIAGPFLATTLLGKAGDEAIKDAMKNKAFPPELTRDFSATLDTFDKPRQWQRQEGQDDYVDFLKMTGQGRGSIHYSVTYIVSPIERDVDISYSTDYYAKLWLNGKVAQEDFQPGGHPKKGQMKQVLHLQKGANELLLKVGSGSGGNGFWMAMNNPGDLRFAPMSNSEQSNTKKEKNP